MMTAADVESTAVRLRLLPEITASSYHKPVSEKYSAQFCLIVEHAQIKLY